MQSQHLIRHYKWKEWVEIFAKDSNVSKKLQEADLSANDVSDVANSVAVNTLLSMLEK